MREREREREENERERRESRWEGVSERDRDRDRERRERVKGNMREDRERERERGGGGGGGGESESDSVCPGTQQPHHHMLCMYFDTGTTYIFMFICINQWNIQQSLFFAVEKLESDRDKRSSGSFHCNVAKPPH